MKVSSNLKVKNLPQYLPRINRKKTLKYDNYSKKLKDNQSIQHLIRIQNQLKENKYKKKQKIQKQFPSLSFSQENYDSKFIEDLSEEPTKLKNGILEFLKGKNYQKKEERVKTDGNVENVNHRRYNVSERHKKQQQIHTDTLENFKLKIEENRRYIKDQKELKNNQNSKRQKKKMEQHVMSSKSSKSTQRRQSNRSEKLLDNVEIPSINKALYDYFQRIKTSTNKRSPILKKRNNQNQQYKIGNLIKRVNEIKENNNSSQINNPQSVIEKLQYKRQDNFLKWKRINIFDQDVSYDQSSFEAELARIQQYAKKNSLSMKKYMKISHSRSNLENNVQNTKKKQYKKSSKQFMK